MNLLQGEKMFRVLIGILFAMVCALSVDVGQSTFGSIVGVVHDKSQSVVPGASVQLRSLEENSVRATTADQDGAFEFLNVKPGTYALTVRADGFADYQMPSAELSARQALRIDVVLTVKSDIQTVEVSESAVAINTENGVIGDAKVS